jgi:site-specific recombinase XerD
MNEYSIDRYGDDLRLAGKRPNTVKAYCENLGRFERWVGQPASQVGEAEVRAFLLHLRERGVAPRTYTVYLAALCFLFRRTLRRPEVVDGLPSPRAPRTQVVVPTVDEVRSILRCASTPFARTMFETAYACGLRASEVCALQAGDIDSQHGLVHVRHGKGDKARVVMLGDQLLVTLRQHWRNHRLIGPWLFPRRVPAHARTRGTIWDDQPVARNWLSRTFLDARQAAGLRRQINLHGLRHAFATHLLEHGVDTAILRVLMGHVDIATTAHYATVRTNVLATTPSPLDLLYRT